MEIEINKIKEMLVSIFDDLHLDGKDQISLDKDYYWSLSSNEIYNPYQEPTELVTGKFSEDYEMLIKTKNENKLTCSDLKKLSAILRYIADEKCH